MGGESMAIQVRPLPWADCPAVEVPLAGTDQTGGGSGRVGWLARLRMSLFGAPSGRVPTPPAVPVRRGLGANLRDASPREAARLGKSSSPAPSSIPDPAEDPAGPPAPEETLRPRTAAPSARAERPALQDEAALPSAPAGQPAAEPAKALPPSAAPPATPPATPPAASAGPAPPPAPPPPAAEPAPATTWLLLGALSPPAAEKTEIPASPPVESAPAVTSPLFAALSLPPTEQPAPAPTEPATAATSPLFAALSSLPAPEAASPEPSVPPAELPAAAPEAPGVEPDDPKAAQSQDDLTAMQALGGRAKAEHGFVVDWFGLRTPAEIAPELHSWHGGLLPRPVPQDPRAPAAAWLGLVHSLASARDRWCALSVQAGRGDLLLAGAVAARRHGLEVALHATEADPLLFGALVKHAAANRLGPPQTRFRQTEVGPADRIPLPALLEAAPHWDWVQISLPSQAPALLGGLLPLLTARVRVLSLTTQSRREEAEAVATLSAAGWRLVAEQGALLSPQDPIRALRPGVQAWRSPEA